MRAGAHALMRRVRQYSHNPNISTVSTAVNANSLVSTAAPSTKPLRMDRAGEKRPSDLGCCVKKIAIPIGMSDIAIVYPVAPLEAGLDGEKATQVAFDTARALMAAGIEIPFPQQDLHVRSVSPAAAAAFAGFAQPPGTRPG